MNNRTLTIIAVGIAAFALVSPRSAASAPKPEPELSWWDSTWDTLTGWW